MARPKHKQGDGFVMTEVPAGTPGAIPDPKNPSKFYHAVYDPKLEQELLLEKGIIAPPAISEWELKQMMPDLRLGKKRRAPDNWEAHPDDIR